MRLGVNFFGSFRSFRCALTRWVSIGEAIGKEWRVSLTDDCEGSSVKTKSTLFPRKKGPDRNETAVKSHPPDKNFKQSRDLHEDRGARQMKTGSASGTLRRG
jgi:hypothetical protein